MSVRSGKWTAIVLAIILVLSAVAMPVVATGASFGDRYSALANGGYDSYSPNERNNLLIGTGETNSTSSIHDNQSGITISFTGDNIDSDNVSITPYPEAGDHELPTVGPTAHIALEKTSSEEIEPTTVSLPLTEAASTDDSESLAVYQWTGAGVGGWQPLQTDLDVQQQRVNATVSSLGYFTVLNQTVWEEQTQIERPNTIQPETANAVYVGDANGSISKVSTDSGTVIWKTQFSETGKTTVASDPNGAVYGAVNRSGVVHQIDWFDGSTVTQASFDPGVFELSTTRENVVFGAANVSEGGNVTAIDARSGYRPWTLTFFSEQGPEYRLDDITHGTDGAVYAGLYFEGRESGTRLVQIRRGNTSVDTNWETDIAPNYINDLIQGSGTPVFVTTSSGIHAFNPTDGSELWSTPLSGGGSELAVTDDGQLYAIEKGNKVTAPTLLRVDPSSGSIVESTDLPVDDETAVVGLETATDGSVYVGTRRTENRIIRGDESLATDSDIQISTTSDQKDENTGATDRLENTSSNTAHDVGNSTDSASDLPRLTANRTPTEADQSDRTGSASTPTPDTFELYSASVTTAQSDVFSISAQENSVTTDETVTLTFRADPSQTATLRVKTTTGQEVYSEEVDATAAPKQFRLSIPQTGEYVASLETNSQTDSTDPITVTQPDGNTEPKDISLSASVTNITTDERLSLTFSSDQSTNATLTLETTGGQEVYSTDVVASSTQQTLRLSIPQSGEYVATIESESGGLTDTAGPITVTSPDDTLRSSLSIQALENNITPEEDLIVEFSAAENRNATITVTSSSGQTVLETGVTARQQPQQLSIPNLPVGEYDVTISTPGDLQDSTEPVVVDESNDGDDGSTSDPNFKVTAPPNEFTTNEPLTVQIDSGQSRNVSLTVETTGGQATYQTSLSVSSGLTNFRLDGVPEGEYTVTVDAGDGGPQATTDPVTIKSLEAGIKLSEPVADKPITFTPFVNEIGQNDTITEANWNFGDGTTTSSTAPVEHVYDEPGKYTIELTLVDEFGDGTERTATGTILVRNATDDTAGAGTITSLTSNGSVDWQQTTETDVTGFTAPSGIDPNRTVAGDTTPVWSVAVPDQNRTMIEAAVRSNSTEENATLVARASNGSTRTVSTTRDTWTTVRLPVTDFAGDEITVTGRSSGEAPAKVRDVRLLMDSDEDRVPNYIEEQTFRLPFGKAPLVSLNPQSSDTSGDGLTDGRAIRFAPANGSALADQMRPILANGNPEVPDTDGDGLNDSVESQYGFFNPFTADSNQNGVSDPDDDYDGDSLSNDAELSFGTDPRSPDTDGDGLSDFDEAREYDTDPLAADTDDDGLLDSNEIDLETDPHDEDTNDNGVFDGNETYTTTTSNESVSVSLELTGEGNIADGTTIEPERNDAITGERVDNVSVSEIVRLESKQGFKSAEVTLEYADAAAEENESLVMVTYNESKQMYEPLNSTVDRQNNTVTAETPHFSTFTVFSADDWSSTWNAKPPEEYPAESSPTDIVYVIDESGSMSGSRIESAKTAVKRFTASLNSSEQAGVVGFDSSAQLYQQLTTDHQQVNASASNLTAGGGTDIAPGLQEGLAELERNGMENRSKELIVLSDGKADTDAAVAVAENASARGIEINAVGLGDNVDNQTLREIATATGGGFFHARNSSDLPAAFERIANTPEDSDGDGLPDELERGGITVGIGNKRVKTDLNRSDTDGDGLTDGDEIGEYTESIDPGLRINVSYYKLKSDPTDIDSDDDSLSDWEETQTWETDPLDKNTDGDQYTDDVDPDPTLENEPPEIEAYGSWRRGLEAIEVSDEYGIDEATVKVAYTTEDSDDVNIGTLPTDPRTDYEGVGLGPAICYQEPCYGFYSLEQGTPVPDDGIRVGYMIDATDQNGNKESVVLAPKEKESESDGDPEITTEAAVGGTFATTTFNRQTIQSGSQVFVRELPSLGQMGSTTLRTAAKGTGVGLTVLISFTGTAGGGEGATDPYNLKYSTPAPDPTVPATATIAGTYTVTSELSVEEVTLYEGFSAVQNGQHRGYGLEHITAATSVTKGDIRNAINNVVHTIDQGSRQYVIGEAKDGTLVAITIANGLILQASQTVTIEREEYEEEGEEDIDVIPADDLSDPPEGPRPVPPEAFHLVRIAGGLVVKSVGDWTAEQFGDEDEDQDVDQMEVQFIDVGKGTSILVDGPEEDDTMLLDAGNGGSETNSEIQGVLDEEGIETIDSLVLTHNHSDHIGGADEIIGQVGVDRVYHSDTVNEENDDQEDLRDAITEYGVGTTAIKRGDGGQLTPSGDSYDVQVLNPLPENQSDIDKRSVVLHISYQEQSFLLPSDIYQSRETTLVEDDAVDVKADVLQLSHHGSKNANSQRFLKAVDPSAVTISSSTTAAQPHSETFDRLSNLTDSNMGPQTYWTGAGKVHGTVSFTVRDGLLYVDTENDAPTDPNQLKERAS